jgi:uncharacterized protein YprB with RNaseH-like and TPR domain
LGERERARRVEIERLLSSHPGVLRRASEITAPAASARGRPVPLHELVPTLAPVTTGSGGRLLASTQVVPARAIEPAEAHPRGYLFAGAEIARTVRLPVPGDAMAILAGDESMGGLTLERLAFLDTETTGLMGSSGTYAFLVGLGFFRRAASGDGYQFVCEQYFMEDYCHEPALLEHLAVRLKDFDGFVSFNGRGYDLPLLQARFVMNRMRVDLERPHLDLLTVCRRFFKPRIGSCSLSNVEMSVLGLRRTHDIDGGLIPTIYMDYVRGGRADRLVPVLDHNAQDVISMGALLAHLAGLVTDPSHPGADDAWVCLGAAQMLCRCGRTDLARARLEHATASADREGASRARRALARLLRKTGDVAGEAGLWRAEIQSRGAHRAEAVVELAKVLEWRLRDLAGARDLVEKALRDMALERQVALMGGRLDLLPVLERLETDLCRRLERLTRRLASRREG